MRKKLWFSPLFIVFFVAILGIGVAGAAIYLGGSGTSGEVNLQKGLVGWWKFDGNARDATPNSNNGALNGNTILGNDRKAQANKAYYFDGTGDYIDMGDPANQSLDIQGALTYSAWIYAETFSGSPTIMAKYRDGAGTANATWFGLATDGKIQAFVYDQTNNTVRGREKASAVSLNTWTHVAFTYNGGTTTAALDIYVNGVAVDDTDNGTAGTFATIRNIATSFRVGEADSGGSPAYPFKGYIDDARVYNRALSSAEIVALSESYNSGVVVSDLQKGLVGNWKLNGNVRDATPNSNHGTVSGASLTTDRKAQLNKAYQFTRASGHYITMGDVAALNFERTNAFSVSAWIKLDSASITQFIVSKTLAVAPFTGWDLRLNSNNTISVVIRNSEAAPDNKIVVSTTSTVSDTSGWHNVSFTYDGSSLASGMKIYLDGISQAFTTNNDTLSASILNTASVNIGSRNNSAAGSVNFDGKIDDVRIYNRVLSAAEITAIYESYDPGIVVSDLQKGLIGNWKFDGNAKDYTPYSNNGTVSGTSLTTDRKGQSSKAYSFVSSESDYIDLGTSVFSTGGDALSAFSISLWVNPTTTNSNKIFVIQAPATERAGDIALWGRSTNTLVFDRWDGTDNSGDRGETSTGALTSGQWQHIIATWSGGDNGVRTIYINGVSQSLTNTNNVNTGGWNINTTLIGGNFAGYFYNGVMDDVRFYNRALTASEALALYESY